MDTPKGTEPVGEGMSTDSCVAEWCADADWCDVACTADVLSGKWQPVVITLLLDGPKGFATLETEADGIASNVLSSTLQRLEDDGIVDRTVVSERPHRVEYALTERGAALEPVVDAMATWGRQHGVDPQDARGVESQDVRGVESQDVRGDESQDVRGVESQDVRGDESQGACGDESQDACGDDASGAPGC